MVCREREARERAEAELRALKARVSEMQLFTSEEVTVLREHSKRCERAEGALRLVQEHLQKPHYQGAPLVGDPLTHMLSNIPPHVSDKTVIVDRAWYEELRALASLKSSEVAK